MAVDTKIPQGDPGVASFGTESFGNIPDIRYGDTPMTTTSLEITASGADIDLPLYAVIAADGTAAAWNATPGSATANYVLAAALFVADGSTVTVPVIRTGHLEAGAMTWDTSYDTAAKRKAAFEGSVSPGIFVSERAHTSDAIY